MMNSDHRAIYSERAFYNNESENKRIQDFQVGDLIKYRYNTTTHEMFIVLKTGIITMDLYDIQTEEFYYNCYKEIFEQAIDKEKSFIKKVIAYLSIWFKKK